MTRKLVALIIGLVFLAADGAVAYYSLALLVHYVPWILDGTKAGEGFKYFVPALGGIGFVATSLKLVIFPIFQNVFSRNLGQEEY